MSTDREYGKELAMRSIEILEIHVAHRCNLSCESCSHFAGNGLQGLVGLDEAEAWMSAWNRRLQPKFFGLLGGEPALCIRTLRSTSGCGRIGPPAHLYLGTNGLPCTNTRICRPRWPPRTPRCD